jgi:hypothetical protein
MINLFDQHVPLLSLREIRDNPEFAGQAGALDAPQLGALQSVTPAAYEARAAHSRAMAARIAAIVAAGGLSEAGRTCAELVRSQHAGVC